MPLHRVYQNLQIRRGSARKMSFEVFNPHALNEALDAISADSTLVPLAGATDLMVYLEAGSLPPCTFLNLQELQELRQQDNDGSSVKLGALTTYRDVRIGNVGKQFPMLASAAREVGALAIQNRGTWVGNIANASPAADGVPALMAYDAEVHLTSRNAERVVPLHRFYSGYKQMDRRADELITSIHLPVPRPGWQEYFRKVGARRFQAISKTLLAGRILMGADKRVEDVRMVFASVAPYTLRAVETEKLIRGR